MIGEYVQVIINDLNEPFLDFSIFNVLKLLCFWVIDSSKLIGFKHYPNDGNDRHWITTHWLNMLITKFLILEANVAFVYGWIALIFKDFEM
jgi:hypothetical protein